jgi:hypothetical protein
MHTIFSMRNTWTIDLENHEGNLLGAMDAACWRRTWFSDSKLVIFPSGLIIELWDSVQPSEQIKCGIDGTSDDDF